MPRVMRRPALLAAALLVADGLLYLGLRVSDTRRIFYDRSDVDPHRLQYWAANGFDAGLGWDLGTGSRDRLGAMPHRAYRQRDRYKIKAFGDSFTFGSDVAAGENWTAVIEGVTGWECLNYGVPGYGTDQAYLKYRRTSVPTEYTILGIQQENIARVVNIYRAFYMEDWGPPKPRFFLDGEGLRLEPNPIGKAEDARRLLDRAFVEGLRRLDYWPRYNEEVLGAPRRLQWPAAWTILGHAPFFAGRAWLEFRVRQWPNYEDEVRRYRHHHLYDESSEAFQILSRVVDEFVRLCRRRGEKPLVLVFPLQHTVDLMKTYGRSVYGPLVRRLAQNRIPHIDFGPVFVREHYVEYYLGYNGHLSAAGNERVAREVIHFLGRPE